jgi:type IV pilus assembly protein PilE
VSTTSNQDKGNMTIAKKGRVAAPPGIKIRRQRISISGFTLVEVMVVVAIIGILSAIAIPSYSDYVRRSQRAEARTILLEAAQFMQRFYSANDRYDRSRAGAVVALPTALQLVPTGSAARYAISLSSVSTTAYTLQAAPLGSMAGDKCGTFTLTSVGRRDLTGATDSVTNCWR